MRPERGPQPGSETVAVLENRLEAELSVREGMVVTRHEAETIESAHGRIRVVPAWRFLLRHLYPID